VPTIDGINALTFTISFGDAHQGQNFESIDETHWKFKFSKIALGVFYTEVITPASYLISAIAVDPDENPVNRNSIITPASFTLRTSRTDPLEPQPVSIS
jgi:hypothetical protein